MFTELIRYRHLVWGLTWRDLCVRYRQSLLGVGWAILLPVSMMAVFTFVFTRALEVSPSWGAEMPYALFAYAGLVPWTFFSMSLGQCLNSLVSNRNLVTKVYCPREVFPLSCIASSFVDFLIALLVLFGLAVYFSIRGECRFSPGIGLLFLPVVILVQAALTAGIGMILAMANLFYRDVRQVFGVAIQLLMFVSAVVVPVPRDGSTWSQVLWANPLVPLISAYRDCIILGRTPDAASFLYVSILSILFLIGGWYWFRRLSYRFAERI